MSGEDRLRRYCARIEAAEPVSTVIREALRDPKVFVFGELFSLPAVHGLAGSADQSLFDLLVIFAYGALNDYHGNASVLPTITPEEVLKLKRLTMLSVTSKSREIRYDELMGALELSDERELEDFVIDLVYSDLMTAKLNQRRRVVIVEHTVSRDVPNPTVMALSKVQNISPVTSVEAMIESVSQWRANANSLLAGISKNINLVRANDSLVEAEAAEIKKNVDQLKREFKASAKAKEGASLGEPVP